MKRIMIALLLLFLPAFALAETDRVTELEKRVEVLEDRNAELYHDLAGKKGAGLATAITERITISGLIEAEASAETGHFDGGNSESASDLTLATAQLGFGIEATENMGADLILLFEEGGDEEVAVDEATVNFELGPWKSRIGRQYLPFGNFNSHFISDPLTLELGETQETAVLAGYGDERWSISAFLFNGDAEEEGSEDHISDYGASLSVTPTENFKFGLSYLSDLADTDGELLGSDYEKKVGGYSAYLLARLGPVDLSGEILAALESFDAQDLDADGNGTGDEPTAWNIEAAVHPAANIELALRYEESDEFADQPESQYGICLSWRGWENLSLSVEYLRGEFDRDFAPTDGDGNALEDRDLVTAQLAIEF